MPTSANPTVLETLQAYGAVQNPVNARLPQDFQMFSTSGMVRAGAAAGEQPAQKQVPRRAFSSVRNDNTFELWALKTARNSMVFRSELAIFGARRIWASPDGRRKIEKRSFWRSLL
jgi:hypothetical protein